MEESLVFRSPYVSKWALPQISRNSYLLPVLQAKIIHSMIWKQAFSDELLFLKMNYCVLALNFLLEEADLSLA